MTQDGFDQAIVNLIAKLVQDPSAKETFLASVQEGNHKKSRDVDVFEYTKLFCILIDHADRLPPETDDNLTT